MSGRIRLTLLRFPNGDTTSVYDAKDILFLHDQDVFIE
jgi:hypothetical protein